MSQPPQGQHSIATTEETEDRVLDDDDEEENKRKIPERRDKGRVLNSEYKSNLN